MERVFNFSSSPAALPYAVLHRAQEGLVSFAAGGRTVPELSVLSPEYDALADDCEKRLRALLSVPDSHKILFMSGDSSHQYAAIPLNLLTGSRKADYIISGQSSKSAGIEAKKWGDIAVAASAAGANFSFIPATTQESFRPDADYVHFCFNNSRFGTRFPYIPETGGVPLVADMTTYLLSEPLDVTPYAVIYAGGHINLGAAGITAVIIREDLIGTPLDETPAVLDYQAIADGNVTRNLPPAWQLYLMRLMLEWTEAQGGLAEMGRRNAEKAALLYEYLDHQDYYIAPVDQASRSSSNIVFLTPDPELDRKFVTEAAQNGLFSLRGHKQVGGMCASLYNAMPREGVEKLITFMKQFATDHPAG